MFRVSRDGKKPITNVDTFGQRKPAIRASKPRRYHIDEISRDPLPSGHTSRRWGVGIKKADGSVVLEPDRWSPLNDTAS
jgi:hypothetical protein